MLLHKKDIESKIYELEKEYCNSEKILSNLFYIYREYCGVNIFKIKHGKYGNIGIIKVDCLNRKIIIYKYSEYDEYTKSKFFKTVCSVIDNKCITYDLFYLRNFIDNKNILKLDIDENLDDSLFDSNVYAYIVSTIEKIDNYKNNILNIKKNMISNLNIKNSSNLKIDNFEFIEILENMIIKEDTKNRNIKEELDKYKNILNKLI